MAYDIGSTEYYILSDALIEKFEDIEWNLVHNYDPKEDTFEDVEFLLDDLRVCADLIAELLGSDIYQRRYETDKEATEFEFKSSVTESIDAIDTSLRSWISNPRNKKRYGNDNIIVVCMTPYDSDISDDVPGVLFDGTFKELESGTGDNYIAEDYDDLFVTQTTYKKAGYEDYLEISVDWR